MSDRDDLRGRVADIILARAVCGGREGTEVTAEARDCPDYLDCIDAADAVLAVLPSSDGPLREAVRQKVDFYRPPLVGGVVGYSSETITGISKDDAFEYALAFYYEIRALLDGRRP